MDIRVDKYEPQEDGSAILEISYDDEFAEFAIRQFVLWSIERQIQEGIGDDSSAE